MKRPCTQAGVLTYSSLIDCWKTTCSRQFCDELKLSDPGRFAKEEYTLMSSGEVFPTGETNQYRGVHIFNFSKYYVTCPLCALIDFIFAHHEWHLPPQLFLICSLASLVDGELYRALIRQLNHLFYLEGLFTSLFPMVHLPSRLSDNSLSDPALMLPAVSLPNDQVSSLLTFYSVSQANCYKYLQTSTVSLK